MSKLKRRHFLQFSGSLLAAAGLSQFDLFRQGDRARRVLAQSTNRKLALLVGANAYPADISDLRGCLTDVEMQQELLVGRFGFNRNDIQIVSDNAKAKPTRANILGAFEEHLVKQAKPGDVVVFHFSGHGSRVKDPNPIPGLEGLNGTMVPYDTRLDQTRNSDQVGDIMGKTLFLLMQALPTDNVTVILDSCHSGGGTRGNLRVRAIPSRFQGGGSALPSEEELAYQEQWLSRLDLTRNKLQELRTAGIAKGVALGSAQADQLATDAPFSGFHAGAFSYLLTQYLWQQTAAQPLKQVFVNLARRTKDVANASHIVQEPVYQTEPDRAWDNQPVYLLKPGTPAAEGMVRQVQGEQVEFWLGGISSQSIESFQEGALFNLIDGEGNKLGEVAQTARSGLVGYGKIQQGQGQAGMLMREQIRSVPADLSLRVGLDSSLGEANAQVREALQSVNRVEVMEADGESPADYLLGRATESVLSQARQSSAVAGIPLGSLGLFTSGLSPVPDSFGRVGENPTTAVNRLRPRMKMLLAGKILGSILEGEASEVKVAATVEPVGGRGQGDSFGSRGAREANLISQSLDNSDSQMKAGTEIQVRIQNEENQNLYLAVLVIASDGTIVVLHPTTWDSPETAAIVGAKESITVPKRTGSEDDFQFIVQGPSGFFELLVLASTEPLRDALKGLQNIARGRDIRSGDPLLLEEDEPVDVMGALLGDLDRNARAGVVTTRGGKKVDSKRLAALSTIVEVVE